VRRGSPHSKLREEVVSTPVEITAEAADQIVRLGLRLKYAQMIEHIRRVVPELSRIEVDLWERYELGEPAEPSPVAIDVYRTGGTAAVDETHRELRRWCVRTFPPEVVQHLGIWTHDALRRAES
jgi:hypothetical protein